MRATSRCPRHAGWWSSRAPDDGPAAGPFRQRAGSGARHPGPRRLRFLVRLRRRRDRDRSAGCRRPAGLRALRQRIGSTLGTFRSRRRSFHRSRSAVCACATSSPAWCRSRFTSTTARGSPGCSASTSSPIPSYTSTLRQEPRRSDRPGPLPRSGGRELGQRRARRQDAGRSRQGPEPRAGASY